MELLSCLLTAESTADDSGMGAEKDGVGNGWPRNASSEPEPPSAERCVLLIALCATSLTHSMM